MSLAYRGSRPTRIEIGSASRNFLNSRVADRDSLPTFAPPGNERLLTRAKANDEREEERICELRTAIQLILGRESDLTADEIWERLPDDIRVNKVRFQAILPGENGKLWVRKGKGGKGGPYVYALTVNVAKSPPL